MKNMGSSNAQKSGDLVCALYADSHDSEYIQLRVLLCLKLCIEVVRIYEREIRLTARGERYQAVFCPKKRKLSVDYVQRKARYFSHEIFNGSFDALIVMFGQSFFEMMASKILVRRNTLGTKGL